MSGREQSLAARRLELVQRSTAQRAALIADLDPLVSKAATVDRIVAKVRRYPVISALAVGGLALLGARRILDITTQVMAIYALFKR